MKTKLKRLLQGLPVLLLQLLAWIPQALDAQQNPAQCVANIQKRLDALGNAPGFDFLEARDIMKDFDFGKIPDAVADPGKAAAFKRVFTSLSEFIDLAPNSISGKGMKGYTRFSGAGIIRANGSNFVPQLKKSLVTLILMGLVSTL